MSKHASDCIPLADVCTGMGWSRLNFLAGLWVGQHLLKVEVELVDKKNPNALQVLVWTFAVCEVNSAAARARVRGHEEEQGAFRVSAPGVLVVQACSGSLPFCSSGALFVSKLDPKHRC